MCTLWPHFLFRLWCRNIRSICPCWSNCRSSAIAFESANQRSDLFPRPVRFDGYFVSCIGRADVYDVYARAAFPFQVVIPVYCAHLLVIWSNRSIYRSSAIAFEIANQCLTCSQGPFGLMVILFVRRTSWFIRSRRISFSGCDTDILCSFICYLLESVNLQIYCHCVWNR